MPVADKIVALFAALTREEVDTMPPAQRERFAALCQHWSHFARLRPEGPKAAVLAELRNGGRGE